MKDFADNTAFARDLRGALAAHWAPGSVSFRGSFQAQRVDAYSDVDLLAEVHRPLDESFYGELTDLLETRYGRMVFWYDDEHEDNPQAQQVRFCFYHLPIFWRVDLEIASDQPCTRKYPDAFPAHSPIRSALWNLVWAVKYANRTETDHPYDADHYVGACCAKLDRDALPYSPDHVRLLLDALAERDESNLQLVELLRGAV